MIERPKHGRGESMDLAMDILLRMRNPTIVEIGTARSGVDRQMGDGVSTLAFAWCAEKTGGFFVSIDINAQNLGKAFELLLEEKIPASCFELIHRDGIEFFKTLKRFPIDFLYLDAWDWVGSDADLRNSELKHLEAFQAAQPSLVPKHYILIDDVHNQETYEGKGKLLIPYLLERGYTMLYKGYQFLFESPE